MPAEFETGYVVREPAWHGLADVLDEPLTAADALVAAGQDWRVGKAPLIASVPEHGPTTVPRFFATYRDDTGDPLGVVGKDWTPVQNADAFAFLDELVGGGELRFESCGVLKGGQKVYMVAAHPDYMELSAGEQIKRYLLCWNGHAGTLSFGTKRVNERVVCANTLGIAMAERGSTFRTRHTSGVEYRTAEARDVLGLAFAHDERFARMAEELIHTPLAPGGGQDVFVERLFPLPERGGKDSRAASNALEARERVLSILRNGEDLENIRTTAWGALQAATEYADWHTTIRGGSTREATEARFARNWLKDDPIKVRAMGILAPTYLPRKLRAAA